MKNTELQRTNKDDKEHAVGWRVCRFWIGGDSGKQEAKWDGKGSETCDGGFTHAGRIMRLSNKAEDCLQCVPMQFFSTETDKLNLISYKTKDSEFVPAQFPSPPERFNVL